MTTRFAIEGASLVRADLRRFAPDLHRDLQRTLAGEARMVATTAKGLMPPRTPLSGWARAWQGDRLRWDPGAAVSGIKGSTARGRRTKDGYTAVVVVQQTDPAGAVFEVAGRRNKGSAFARNLTGWWGPASRGVWRAAELKRASVEATVAAAVARAERALTDRLKAGAGKRAA